MRVLFLVSQTCVRGGAERQVSILSQHLAKSHDVTVASYQMYPLAYDFGGRLYDLNLAPVPSMPARLAVASARVVRLIQLFQELKPDRIIAVMESAGFPASLAARALGIQHRLLVNVTDNPSANLRTHRTLLPFLYRPPVKVVPVSDGVRSRLLKDFHLVEEFCQTIPNAISLEAIAAELEADRGRFDPPSKRYFVTVGRLSEQKGHDLLLKAYQSLPGDRPDLVILGDGPERGRLEEAIASAGLEAQVTLCGVKSNPYSYMANAVAFVLSSRHEGWPMVLMEAMGCGCPIVSFDCPYGPREVLQEGRAGLLLPMGDIAALAEGMNRVAHDEALRASLRAAGLARAAELDVTRLAERWLS